MRGRKPPVVLSCITVALSCAAVRPLWRNATELPVFSQDRPDAPTA